MEKIRIGKIVGAAALRGEVKIYCYGSPERFAEVEALLLAGRPSAARQRPARSGGPGGAAPVATATRGGDTPHSAPADARIASYATTVAHDACISGGAAPADAREAAAICAAAASTDPAAPGFTRYEIESARVQKNMAIVKLRGVEDRNAAEALRDSEVYITEGDLPPLPEDTYYVRDLNGCRVEDAETGQTIGRVREVIQNTAQDVYVVELAGGGETMIPAVAEFVKSVDVAAKLIRVKLIPGFIDGAGVTVED